jgi:outer membrane protein assembly factor BamB
VTLVGVLVAGTVAILDADWPSFRGGASQGVATGSPPTAFDLTTGTNIAWRTPIPGLGHSSPIAAGSLVFVTTAVSSAADTPLRTGAAGVAMADDLVEHEWRIYALDRVAGSVRWQQTAFRGTLRASRHVKNTYATATPATDGRFVVAVMGSQGLVCYDVSGRLRWTLGMGVVDLGVAQDAGTHFGSASSPIIVGNRVIVQNDRKSESLLAAYDLATGRELWKASRDEWSAWATPVVTSVGGRQIVVTNSPRRVRVLGLGAWFC